MIAIALSVVAVLVAGLGFLIAVESHRRSERAPLVRRPVPRAARDLEDAEHDGPREADEDGYVARPLDHRVIEPRALDPRVLDPRARDQQALDPRALRDMAVVRYDALQEMSGQLSFSLALLNAQGDGIVLSSINGRAETRTYAKAIVAFKGTQELSPEEEEAVRVARAGQGPATQPRVTAKPKITSQTGAPSAATV